MAASTINRTDIGTNDSGGGTDGTVVNTAYVALAVYDKIDALIAAQLNFGSHISVPATSKVFLDGGGDTYLIETSANQIDVFAAAVNALRITSTSVSPLVLLNLSGAGAGQIEFPATQVASTNANTLDDYEESTWTPVIGGSGGTSGQTYTTQKGRCVKIGRLVVAWFYVALSAKGTITTNVQIQGLPFTSENVASQFAFACVPYFNTLATNWITLGGYMDPNTTAFTLQGRQTAGTDTVVLATADIANGTVIGGLIVYTAAA